MSKRTTYKSIIIASIVLGIFISLQLKSINIDNNGMTTSKKGEQLASELKSLKKEEEQLKSEIEIIKERIDTYRGIEGDKSKDIIKEEINKYEILAGYTNVKGEGIDVSIQTLSNSLETDASSSIVYNYDLLLSLINKLNSAQANAISINGQRIVADSYLHLKEDNLYINGTVIKPPYVIKAIGNPDTLASALQIKYGIVWEIEKYYNAKVTIEKSKDIEINGHNKKIESNHSNANE
ncbi:DUF881 domain-containing protein [Romboutsia weinsteinii]|nr:DUF881 domain-containing protein [Romboutsia weinsteinii]